MTDAWSISVEMSLGSEWRIMPHVLMVIPQQFSHVKLQPFQCFSALKTKGFPDCMRLNNSWPALPLSGYADMNRVYHYWHSHLGSFLSLLWGSHTHSWHSVEIFSSLVLPRKILTRAPKFPVLGLFSTGKKKRVWENLSTALHNLQHSWNESLVFKKQY